MLLWFVITLHQLFIIVEFYMTVILLFSPSIREKALYTTFKFSIFLLVNLTYIHVIILCGF